jgi:hypothetical protein
MKYPKKPGVTDWNSSHGATGRWWNLSEVMEGGPWSGYGDLPNSCLFSSWLWGKQLPLQWAPAMMYFWALYRPKGNGAKWWCTENSKVNRQYKSFLILSWFSEVFYHNNRKLKNTVKNHSIPKSNMELKKLKIEQLFLYPTGSGWDRAHRSCSVSSYYSSLNRIKELTLPYTLPYY